MQGLKAFGNGIYAVDSGYTGPDVAAIHLIEQGGRVALVDTGNNESLGPVREALAELGLGAEAVDFQAVFDQAMADAERPLNIEPLPISRLGDVHKVIVTGANSFVGVHLVEALLAGGAQRVAVSVC